MSSRAQLFIGRLPKETRRGDLEEIFKRYGRVTRCDVRTGLATAYAFIDFDDHRDAEDAVKYENGRDIHGQRMVVEWAIDDAKYGRQGGRRGGGYRSYGGGRGGGGGYRDRRSRSRSRSRSNSRSGKRGGGGERRRRSPSRSRSKSYENNRKSERSPRNDRSRSGSRSRSHSK